MAHKILVVDDDPDFRNFAHHALETQGFEVFHAEDGLGGISAAQKVAPDLILLDLDLPAGAGMTVLERMRKIPRLSKVPVLIVTAQSAAIAREKALRKSAAGFLQKPVDIRTLITAVRDGLGTTPGASVPEAESCPTCGRSSAEAGFDPDAIEAIATRVGASVLRHLAAAGIGTAVPLDPAPAAPGPEDNGHAVENPSVENPSENPSLPPIIVEVGSEVEPLVPEYLERRAHDHRLLTDAIARNDLAVIQIIGQRLRKDSEELGFDAVAAIGRALEELADARDRDGIARQIESLGEYLGRVNVVSVESDRDSA